MAFIPHPLTHPSTHSPTHPPTNLIQTHPQVGSDTARQLLGMKGAAETDDLLKIRIQVRFFAFFFFDDGRQRQSGGVVRVWF